MNIKLRYTAQLKDAAEVGEDTVDLNENDGIQVLLKLLATRYNNSFGKILFDKNGDYCNSNLIVVNQSQVNYEEDTKLNNGDQVMLMSPISGG